MVFGSGAMGGPESMALVSYFHDSPKLALAAALHAVGVNPPCLKDRGCFNPSDLPMPN